MRVYWCTKHGFCPHDEAEDKQLSHCLAQNGNRGCPNLIALPDKHPYCQDNANANGNGNGLHGKYMPPIRQKRLSKKHGSSPNGNGYKQRYSRKRARWRSIER